SNGFPTVGMDADETPLLHRSPTELPLPAAVLALAAGAVARRPGPLLLAPPRRRRYRPCGPLPPRAGPRPGHPFRPGRAALPRRQRRPPSLRDGRHDQAGRGGAAP